MGDKKINFLWGLYGAALIILFLLSSTDLIIKEEEAQVYPISVIIRDASDENYVNFRKGMERAAMEFNGDISFITLYEKGNATQQRELMRREQEDGSRALIVAPVDAGMVVDMQRENQLSVPIICINSEKESLSGLDNTAVLTFDYYGMGIRMGEGILKDHPGKERVYLFCGEENNATDKLFIEGLKKALASKGCVTLPFENTAEGNPELALEKVGEKEAGGIVMVVPDPERLLETAQFLSETDRLKVPVAGLYGRGNTVPLLNYLDKGIIQGLCVTDDFSCGYLSVKTAVELSEKRSIKEVGYLASYDIRREDLRNEKYEKILYPIE